jgi:hypothetical protein
MGTLALRWAMGAGGRLTDPEGAFRELQRQPFGTPLLFALIPGFFSYALWRMLTAIYDGDRDGTSWSGLFCRAFGVLKGLIYAAAGVTALRLASSSPGDSSGWVHSVLAGPAGPFILFVVAGSLLAFGCFEIYRAFQAQLSRGLQLHAADPHAQRWIVAISRFGIGARGLVIAAFAVLLFRYAAAGRTQLPAAHQSIRFLGSIHPALYIFAAAGIIAYGLYLLVLARYRRVNT